MTQLNTPTPDKDSGNLVLILIAVALGIVTIVLTNIYIIDVRKQVEGETETVYRVNRTYKAGEKLKDADLTPVRMRKDMASEQGKFVTAVDLKTRLGDPVLRGINQGDYLTWDAFTSTGQGADQIIAKGMKACPIQVASDGRPGALEPGMLVDVYAPVIIPGQGPRSMLVMEKVRVLMVGDRSIGSSSSQSSASGNARNVTLEVAPPIVEKLFTIQQWLGKSEFLLTIRNPSDDVLQITDRSEYHGINPELMKLVEKTGPSMDVRGRTINRSPVGPTPE